VHYYLQLSEGDPTSDPITLWSNGGPGCTSLKGAFEEIGQLVFNASSVAAGEAVAVAAASAASASSSEPAVPRLYYNPQGWTRKSSMLYFEHPTGVGFSYCDSCVAPGAAGGVKPGCNCAANDTSAALDNYDVLTAFFARYPELSTNEFFITGESYVTRRGEVHQRVSGRTFWCVWHTYCRSHRDPPLLLSFFPRYAGIYIPMMMEQIMDRGLSVRVQQCVQRYVQCVQCVRQCSPVCCSCPCESP